MSGLSEFTDQQLLAELEARRKEAEAALAREHEAHVRAVSMHLTKAIVDCFAPRHGRTSCSDENRTNAFYSDEGSLPRCNRCALLDLAADGGADSLPDGAWVRLHITNVPR